MSKLKQAVNKMEATRAATNPLQALRDWRLAAGQRFMASVVLASKAKGGRK